MGGHDSQELTVEAEDQRTLGLAQPDRVLGQRVEDRLEVEGGPPDHLEQLAGRRLLLERDPQLAVARLQLGEQAHVLDGDDGLVGEGLQEVDLLVGEGPPARARQTTIAPMGMPSREASAPRAGFAAAAAMVTRSGCSVLGIERRVRDVRRPRGSRIARPESVSRAMAADTPAAAAIPRLVTPRDGATSMSCLAVEPDTRRLKLASQSRTRALDDGLEHRLDIRRRARDHAQDLAGRRLLLQRLGEVGVLGLQLGEQARVLDGDGGLVGEGLHAGRSGCP